MHNKCTKQSPTFISKIALLKLHFKNPSHLIVSGSPIIVYTFRIKRSKVVIAEAKYTFVPYLTLNGGLMVNPFLKGIKTLQIISTPCS